jgi:hypothetical protein
MHRQTYYGLISEQKWHHWRTLLAEVQPTQGVEELAQDEAEDDGMPISSLENIQRITASLVAAMNIEP